MTRWPSRTFRIVWASLPAGESLTMNPETPLSMARRRYPGRPNVVRITIFVAGLTR